MAKSVFVISPIGEDGSAIRLRSDRVLRHIIQKALDPAAYEIVRADQDDSPDSITPRMIKRIQDAFLIFVDITGGNPNVFYEMALAHGYRKPIIYLSEFGRTPPFDIKDQRIVPYDLSDPDNLESARLLVAKYAAHIEANPNDQHNPVADADAFFSLREAQGTNSGGEALIDAFEILTSDFRAMRGELAQIREAAEKSVKRAYDADEFHYPSYWTNRLSRPRQPVVDAKLTALVAAFQAADGAEKVDRALELYEQVSRLEAQASPEHAEPYAIVLKWLEQQYPTVSFGTPSSDAPRTRPTSSQQNRAKERASDES